MMIGHSRYKNVLLLILNVFFLLILHPVFPQETVTITTYFPAPFGVYNELQLSPHQAPVTVCDNAHRGTMYFDSDDNLLYVCRGAIDGWVVIGDAWWRSDDNQIIYNINPGNVGIGTQASRGGLEVASGPQWSSFNYGANIILSGNRNNAIGILDSNGANPWAVSNSSGTFTVSTMPAPGNTAASPNGRFVIANNGNVGIGTTAPGQRLDVSGGDLRVATGQGIYLGGVRRTTWPGNGGGMSVNVPKSYHVNYTTVCPATHPFMCGITQRGDGDSTEAETTQIRCCK